jgi:hypothetical protein
LVLTVLNLDYPLAVIGVDPGGTTGVAEYLVHSADALPRLHGTKQWGDPDTVMLQMKGVADYWRAQGYQVVFVVEQFDKRPGIADPDFTPKFIINDINRYLTDEIIIWQTPSQAKNLVKPAKNGAADGLKRFGWYTPGMGHANDASRHVITFLVEKLHHMPTILKGWPKRGKR